MIEKKICIYIFYFLFFISKFNNINPTPPSSISSQTTLLKKKQNGTNQRFHIQILRFQEQQETHFLLRRLSLTLIRRHRRNRRRKIKPNQKQKNHNPIYNITRRSKIRLQLNSLPGALFLRRVSHRKKADVTERRHRSVAKPNDKRRETQLLRRQETDR